MYSSIYTHKKKSRAKKTRTHTHVAITKNKKNQYGAIDVGHVAGAEAAPAAPLLHHQGQQQQQQQQADNTTSSSGGGSAESACILALVRALQYNTFFTHLDLTAANVSAAGCWSEDPLSSSSSTKDVASGPMAMAVQVGPSVRTLIHTYSSSTRGRQCV